MANTYTQIYIHNQKKAFKQEYLEILRKFNVEYDEKYLFKWIDDE